MAAAKPGNLDVSVSRLFEVGRQCFEARPSQRPFRADSSAALLSHLPHVDPLVDSESDLVKFIFRFLVEFHLTASY
jgi:hypothetical protein